MTLTDTTAIIEHDGTGSQDTFTYDFKILDATHLAVYEDGVLTTKGYTVTGAGDDGGGEIIFTSLVPASGVVVSLVREVPYDQQTDYTDGGPFPASAHETALDKLTMLVIQLLEIVNRCVKVPVGYNFGNDETEIAPTAEGLIGFNDAGTAIAIRTDLSTWDSTDFFKTSEVNTFSYNQVMAGTTVTASDHSGTGQYAVSASVPMIMLDLDDDLEFIAPTPVNNTVATVLVRVEENGGGNNLTFSADWDAMGGDVTINDVDTKITWLELIIDGINNEFWVTKIGEQS